jgi:hypothetical protein
MGSSLSNIKVLKINIIIPVDKYFVNTTSAEEWYCLVGKTEWPVEFQLQIPQKVNDFQHNLETFHMLIIQ